MSGFGKNVEVKGGGERKFFTGVNNFQVVAVNPTKDELEAIYGREIDYDLEYIGTTTVSDAAGEREVTQLKVDFYLKNEDDKLNTKITYYLADTFHKSQTAKIKVINDFGATTWLDEESIKSKEVPGNMSWYNTSGMKVAKRGEEELIDFLKNLLNLPIDLSKCSDPSEAYARFDKEVMAKMFKGDTSLLKQIIDSSNNKIGVLLGVKTKADGGLMQATYTKKTLRQYSLHSKSPEKFKYLVKSLDEAKANGAFANVDFGPSDLTFREFVVKATPVNTSDLPEENDVFGATEEEEDWLS